MSELQTAEQINTPQTGKVTVEPPPAATVVVNGTRTEREIELEERLAREEKLRKDREIRNAELEDENYQLKQVRKATEAQQPKQKRKGWLTMFDGDTEE